MAPRTWTTLVVLLAAVMAACGGDDDGSDDGTTSLPLPTTGRITTTTGPATTTTTAPPEPDQQVATLDPCALVDPAALGQIVTLGPLPDGDRCSWIVGAGGTGPTLTVILFPTEAYTAASPMLPEVEGHPDMTDNTEEEITVGDRAAMRVSSTTDTSSHCAIRLHVGDTSSVEVSAINGLSYGEDPCPMVEQAAQAVAPTLP